MKRFIKNILIYIVALFSIMCIFSCNMNNKKSVKGLNGPYVIEKISINSNDKKISGKLYLPTKEDKSQSKCWFVFAKNFANACLRHLNGAKVIRLKLRHHCKKWELAPSVFLSEV